MKAQVKQLAIIGPTASGKSDLAINVAKNINAHILSIDSLSIYKDIDIVSAKPSKKELATIKHFGINLLYPNEYFSVDIFINLYKSVLEVCQKEEKNLIIVGGTSFYLKSLLQGISDIPTIDEEVKNRVKKRLELLHESYEYLYTLDTTYMQNINKNDRYRIEKAYLIYEASGLTPSEWFLQNPPKPIIENIPIFNIEVARDLLRERITKRTHKMLSLGLIDEVCALEHKYSRLPNAMASIGIVEVLEFLDGKVDKKQMLENIATHTAQLAKRQQTFNKTQFEKSIAAPLEALEQIIYEHISC
ncbi:MAG TPA: tRNA (adenosine(37)-N6)-dimethylallyltransferase MiaA [Sulfurimonas sp. UBA12504]|nr:MAG: tRNA (adenosine(37)-N6)-dimethylallyltransferase MiaA [Sulfurimonas sp. GWF2_37_8]DAB30763.1 MAG TPA: tRNA (adenosine(37)-N6)-dimethylallyltransferase MiaA [Sulfurimonas sp. UBA12504]